MQYTHTYEALVAVSDADADKLVGLKCVFHVLSSLLVPLNFNRPLILSVGKTPENENTFGFPVPYMEAEPGEARLHLVERFLFRFLANAVTLEQAGEFAVLHVTHAREVGVVVLSAEGELPAISESHVYTERKCYSRVEYARYLKARFGETDVQGVFPYAKSSVQALEINPVKHVIQAFVD